MNQTQLQAWWVWCLSLGTHETNCKQRSHGRSHSEEHAGNTTGVAPQLQLLIPGCSDAIPLSSLWALRPQPHFVCGHEQNSGFDRPRLA